jgi:hypothetical protein
MLHPGRPALPASNRLGWKGLPGANTLAYYEHSLIAAVKSFITLGRGHEKSYTNLD